MAKELNKAKDARIINQLDRITDIFSGGRRVEIPEGRGQLIFSAQGEVTVVTALLSGEVQRSSTYVDGKGGIVLDKLYGVEHATNQIVLSESCVSYLNAIYEATSEGHIDQSREVGYNYCMIVPDKSTPDANAMIVENINGRLSSHPVLEENIESTTYAIALQRAKFDFANNYGENPIHCLAESFDQDLNS